MGEGDDKLSDGVAWATLKPTYSEASAELVDMMRGALRHAQDIAAAVSEAEVTTELAREAISGVDNAGTPAERLTAALEVERLTAALAGEMRATRGQEAAEKAAAAAKAPAPVNPVAASPAAVPAAAGAPEEAAVAGDEGAAAEEGAEEAGGDARSRKTGSELVAEQMCKEIETTVMWVQQLLESVHLAESDETPQLEPGASLLKFLQPGRRHQKDEALQQSLGLFHEKKEAEKEQDEQFEVFRRRALDQVAAQRAQVTASRDRD